MKKIRLLKICSVVPFANKKTLGATRIRMFKQLSKLAGFAGYVVQYGCWTHVTFEYGGDFVFVSIYIYMY